MAAPQKLGVLVAIPIKGRKLLNRSRGKQSPFIQLKLGSDTKRTKASLIASDEPEWDQEIRLDVFQGALNVHVVVMDEGKKNELIGSEVLLLHEVIDKGELDVWFPIKHNGKYAGEIYFELTFYALAPPAPAPAPPGPAPHRPMQLPPVRHIQPLPYMTPAPMYGNIPRPPPFPAASPYQQHPAGYGSPNPRPYPVPQQHPYPPTTSMPYGRPPNGPGPGYNPPPVAPPFQMAPPHSNPGFGGPQSPPVRYPVQQHPPPLPPGGIPGGPRPGVRPSGPHHGPPSSYPMANSPHRPPGSGPVTPLVQYNYNISSFP
ncbi:hypothetical protein B0O80DRAFT_445208 [Mortierella sp. GBAus27b]|nr:hypothetical protein BGX31_009445 [Mortierella sp. GBA43]KAI8357555.1 hypothetical protein B0O80DRAFT_445208 [Mortierella sp. GBAus27b]